MHAHGTRMYGCRRPLPLRMSACVRACVRACAKHLCHAERDVSTQPWSSGGSERHGITCARRPSAHQQRVAQLGCLDDKQADRYS